jgi:hypothetical protein
MFRFSFLLVAAAILVSLGAAQDICPCGLDVATNCLELLPDFTGNLSDVCEVTHGEPECLPRADNGKARCSCACGVEGEFCEIRIEAQTYNVSGLPS